MSEPFSIALVGAGGYGNNFVTALLDAPNQNDFRFVGTIDPSPTSCRRLADLEARKVPMCSSLENFYEKNRADLLIISSPIQWHASQTCLAVSRGSHVLCEKPLCATLDQAKQMKQARDQAGKHVAIGYQWSFSRAIQQLKSDILAGILGKPKRLRTLVLWPRDEAYYARNRWAGVLRDPAGNLVLDSPVNNACAHFLHNMLYVLGSEIGTSAHPATVSAELYRAHAIQNYDTAALRCRTSDDVELLFIVSHSIAASRGPIFSYEFERATVHFTDGPEGTITAKFHDGKIKDYGSPTEAREAKLWQTVHAIQHRQPTVCGIEAAVAHTQCVVAAQESGGDIVGFPAAAIEITGDPGRRRTTVRDLGETLGQCYEQWKLPSELGVAWAKASRPVTIDQNAL